MSFNNTLCWQHQYEKYHWNNHSSGGIQILEWILLVISINYNWILRFWLNLWPGSTLSTHSPYFWKLLMGIAYIIAMCTQRVMSMGKQILSPQKSKTCFSYPRILPFLRLYKFTISLKNFKTDVLYVFWATEYI